MRLGVSPPNIYFYHYLTGFDVISRNLIIISPKPPTFWSIMLSMCVALGACQSAPEAPEPKPQEVAEPAPAPTIDLPLLHDLLDRAEQAMTRGQLTYPVENSAYAIYAHILDLQPGQEDAMRGMESIVEQYIQLAMQALEHHRYASARSLLSRARIINPNHPSIEPTEQQIRLLSKAQREFLKLTQDQLTYPDRATTAALQSLARLPADSSCRFTISAKNDAQGRWIYQRLAEGSDDSKTNTRIRAQIRIRLPASVERLCFPT